MRRARGGRARAVDRGAAHGRRRRRRVAAARARGAARRRARPDRARDRGADRRSGAAAGDRRRDRALPACSTRSSTCSARPPPYRPLLFVFDDAHWADAASVNLLRHVVAHLPSGAPVLIVVTYRDTDIDRSHALAGALADLRRTPRVARVDLHGLDEAGMRALLAAAGGHELDDNGVLFARRLVEETEGNPFFVREVLRHLIETGTLIQRDGRWVGTVPAGEAGLPGGRARRRRPAALATLRRRERRPARRVGDRPRVRRERRGRGRRLLGRRRGRPARRSAHGRARSTRSKGRFGRFTFAHALVRSTLVDELSTNRRIRLHRQIAEALVARPGSTNVELAHHFCEAATAGVAEQAVRYSCAAGQRGARPARARRRDRDLRARARRHRRDGRRALTAARPGARRPRAGGRTPAATSIGPADWHSRWPTWPARSTTRCCSPPRAGPTRANSVCGRRRVIRCALDLMREALAGLGDEHAVIRARTSAAIAHGQILAPGDVGLRAADEAVALARACR